MCIDASALSLSATLQQVQDAFAAITGLDAIIVDASGKPITEPSGDADRTAGKGGPRREAPVQIDDRVIGAIVLTGDRLAATPGSADDRALRFAHQLASVIADLCRQEIAVRQRADELATLYSLTSLLAGERDLEQVLSSVARSAAEVLHAKAVSIRLISDDRRELVPAAVFGLSQAYLDKGPVLLAKAEIDRVALRGEVVYVADMASDRRVIYPEDAKREGLASILCAGMVYRGEQVGVMRVYSAETREFSNFDRHLLLALGQAAAAAIRNVRLDTERTESLRVQRQVELAAQVQRRLLPAAPPDLPPFDVAARYEPCFELGGDFYDFIQLEHSLAVMVGDVVGKGVPASLLMATLRAALRAHAEDTYDLDEVMAKVNTGLTRDTTESEFATVFYGTIDAESLRLTYCSAGHDPALLLRGKDFTELTEGGMLLGVKPSLRYDKGVVDLLPGDILFAYSDGLTDAMNFDQERFGRGRLRDAILSRADTQARDIVNHVLWEVRRFIGLNSQVDDITLLAVKIRPPAS